MKMIKGDKNQSTLSESFKKFFKKRWAVPAVYLGCAALAVGAVFFIQDQKGTDVAEQSTESEYVYQEEAPDYTYGPTDTAEVNQSAEKMSLPVTNQDAVSVHKAFYDQTADASEQQEALIVVNQTYYPNLGVDLVQDGEPFEVTAAMSGTVTLVEEDPFIGNAVEIEHDGYVTRYQAIEDIAVAEGEEVRQGQVIAQSGVSELNPEAGLHVHFEVLKDGQAIDPMSITE
ncbi:M23 family metallopeptidase [Jeotgalibacillus sp. HH7-29]|uniref:M23 family metallopeptidase n=2 Tax=Jeotgalibacillus haloalkalitolerans TaxID=3104292 RepID=A0ABU5KJ41_9BACL|nr:M23 family metallopeptidase [Jeotgalibacillus sp. HH7-29]